MSERWVDAFNVIHRLPRLASLLETDPGECRARFLEALAPLALRSREQWTVVFDGPRRVVERAPGRLRVVTAPDADGWILAALARHPRPGEVTIVTSDERDIGGPARARGARVMAADELAAALERRRRRREAPSADAAAEKPEAPDEEEVRYWLKRFGDGDTDRRGDTDRADSRGDEDGANGANGEGGGAAP